MKPWPVYKSEFNLSKNSHFYWIQLNNAIPKAWKENLYKEDKNFHDLTCTGHHIIKKYKVYSLTLYCIMLKNSHTARFLKYVWPFFNIMQ